MAFITFKRNDSKAADDVDKAGPDERPRHCPGLLRGAPQPFMWFTIIVFSCLVVMAWCAPALNDSSLRQLPALTHDEIHDENGQYDLHYITAEGTEVFQHGRLVPSQNGGYVLEIEGQYQFIGDDGKLYVTRYRSVGKGPKGTPPPLKDYFMQHNIILKVW
ncbi:Endocuticle structural glycoprotein [Operophtera brumata]|uniref:Endocuticle structural glycoprotein n=1 Tax=Operophtera brumata TaxID=104452 RepID=A0A0L7L9G8_OPEBR|nr:Endocuticle structural glycoprotein [Operophtera brumata]